MKKLYTLAVSVFMVLFGENAFSQFTYSNVNMIQTGNPSEELVLGSRLINVTSGTLSLRVTRQKDVMTDASGWSSAFCMDICYAPFTDSVDYTFNPKDTVDFTFHMYSDATPGHATAMMRWKNKNNASNSFDQTFFGSTDGTMGVNDLNANAANVSIYPMPVVSGDVFSLNVNTSKPSSALNIRVYNVYGSLVYTSPIITGINLMNLDLPGGIYSYSIVSGNDVMNSGTLSVVK